METLTDENRFTEALYLGLRRMEGVDLSHLSERFKKALIPVFEPVMEELCREGLAAWDGSNLHLTRKGFSIADGIVTRLLALV